jgi:hypothetical protein
MIEIFKYADDDERENIAQSFEAAEFKDQREIVVQGHIADAFYIIEEGKETKFFFSVNDLFFRFCNCV